MVYDMRAFFGFMLKVLWSQRHAQVKMALRREILPLSASGRAQRFMVRRHDDVEN
jgi:hypothetical protein